MGTVTSIQPELFRAGLGKAVGGDWVAGAQETPKVLFGNKQDLEQVNKNRAEREKADAALLDTWQGKAGNFAGKAAMFAAAPARIPAQVGMTLLDSLASGGSGQLEGVPGFLADKALRAGTEAGVARLTGVPISSAGHAAGAVKGQYRIPEGQRAMELDAAANRIGVTRNLGSLDQSGRVNAFETSSPQYARIVEGQEKALRDASSDVVQIPSTTGRSYTERTLEGEKFRSGIVEAGQKLLNEGRQGWQNLDDYVVQQGLPGVNTSGTKKQFTLIAQQYTPKVRGQLNLDKNPVIARIAEFDNDAAESLKIMLNAPKGQLLPFSETHQIQAAVGQALRRAEKDAGAPGASMIDRKVKSELKRLYSTLSDDVNNWTTKDARAKEMYEGSKAFWRDAVVPGVLNNKVYNKANRGVYGMNPRGYLEPKQLYSDILNNPMQISDLFPYMNPRMKDLTETFTTMPDVSRAMATNQPHPSASGLGMRQQMAGLAVGSPLYAVKHALSHLPGMNITTTPAGKRLYFSKDLSRDSAAGRAAWGLSQYPQDELVGGLNRIRMGRPEASPKE